MPVIRVTGLAELRHDLQEMSKAAPREFTKSVKKAGQIVQEDAKRRVPQGPHEGGGHVVPLVHTIGLSQGGRVTRQGQIYALRITAGGPGAPHAAPTEFGGFIARRGFKGINRRGKKEAHLRGSGGILTHVKKQPYLLPAIAAKVDEVVAELAGALDRLTQKVKRG